MLARGNAALAAGDAPAAVAAYRAALAQAPGRAELFFNLGNALAAAGEPAEAEAALRRSLALAPDQPGAHNNLGNLLRAAGRAAEALEAYRHAVFLAPADAGLRANFAATLLDLQRPEEAAGWLAQALAAHPADARLAIALGGAEMLCARPRAALEAYRRARALDPADPQAGLGEALARITLGQWRAGWRAYEARLADSRFGGCGLPPPARRWNGGALAGRTLALLAEQGLGDTLQFARYAPLARARGARVILHVQPSLAALLAPLADAVAIQGEAAPAAELWCPLMSLPNAFATTAATVPPAPYLHAPPARVRTWRQRLGRRRGVRLGLAWAGSAEHRLDALRSAPEAAFAPLLDLPGVEAHALQPDARPADPRIAAHPELADFADTAALLALMDVVVTVDTAVAHLAGALGRPGFLLLGFAADFRWMLDRIDTPWYPSLRLVRQRRPGRWDEPLATVAQDLAPRLKGP